MKHIDSMLPCICSVIDHRRGQNVVRTWVTQLHQIFCVPLFCFYHILRSSVIYYWTDSQQHRIYLKATHSFLFKLKESIVKGLRNVFRTAKSHSLCRDQLKISTSQDWIVQIPAPTGQNGVQIAYPIIGFVSQMPLSKSNSLRLLSLIKLVYKHAKTCVIIPIIWWCRFYRTLVTTKNTTLILKLLIITWNWINNQR